MPDPDLEIRGGPGHPDPEIGGKPVSQKNYFGLRVSVWSKNNGWPGPPGSLPWIRH